MRIDLLCAGSASDYFALGNLESVISDIGSPSRRDSPKGGSIYFAPSLRSPYREQTLAELHAYLQVLVLNPSARSLTGRLRLSEGLNLVAYYGGVASDPQGNTFACPCMTPNASIVAEIGIDRYIKKPYAYAQFAVLCGLEAALSGRYHNDQAETCIRVFNYRFAVTSDYVQLYHSIDLTAYLMLLTRVAVAEVEQSGLFDIRERVQDIVATVLATYRNTVCASTPICRLFSLALMRSSAVAAGATRYASAVSQRAAQVAAAGDNADEQRREAGGRVSSRRRASLREMGLRKRENNHA